MTGLRLRRLVKEFRGRRVVDGLSVEVGAQELLVVLGPSGSGKTTMLRMICGLERPDSGAVELGGRDLTGLPSRHRNLGMVFQEYGLYPSLSVYGNLAYGLQAQRVARAEVERRVREAAQALDLTARLGQSTAELRR